MDFGSLNESLAALADASATKSVRRAPASARNNYAQELRSSTIMVRKTFIQCRGAEVRFRIAMAAASMYLKMLKRLQRWWRHRMQGRFEFLQVAVATWTHWERLGKLYTRYSFDPKKRHVGTLVNEGLSDTGKMHIAEACWNAHWGSFRDEFTSSWRAYRRYHSKGGVVFRAPQFRCSVHQLFLVDPSSGSHWSRLAAPFFGSVTPRAPKSARGKAKLREVNHADSEDYDSTGCCNRLDDAKRALVERRLSIPNLSLAMTAEERDMDHKVQKMSARMVGGVCSLPNLSPSARSPLSTRSGFPLNQLPSGRKSPAPMPLSPLNRMSARQIKFASEDEPGSPSSSLPPLPSVRSARESKRSLQSSFVRPRTCQGDLSSKVDRRSNLDRENQKVADNLQRRPGDSGAEWSRNGKDSARCARRKSSYALSPISRSPSKSAVYGSACEDTASCGSDGDSD
eukprot:NODE_1308_length_1593_cov_21.900259_g1173_i0.p1 GENE.NODE_1308_length_1593_cov_21.900259_g1173_i0~~NODE_1308_length_1593_cov_21.900259_g1173_i0.p1  ORF type:complete len:455 (-),score=44.10 NODE_1308_length_1593_cov_21.900259_g1173_i0:148-1512(-)